MQCNNSRAQYQELNVFWQKRESMATQKVFPPSSHTHYYLLARNIHYIALWGRKAGQSRFEDWFFVGNGKMGPLFILQACLVYAAVCLVYASARSCTDSSLLSGAQHVLLQHLSPEQNWFWGDGVQGLQVHKPKLNVLPYGFPDQHNFTDCSHGFFDIRFTKGWSYFRQVYCWDTMGKRFASKHCVQHNFTGWRFR